MITESVSKPDCWPSGVAKITVTRLGWLARNILLVIMATMTCGSSVLILSACTTSAGRGLAVLRLECGNKTRITSPRLTAGFAIVVVDVHFGAFPILGKCSQSRAQIGRLSLVYAEFA